MRRFLACAAVFLCGIASAGEISVNFQTVMAQGLLYADNDFELGYSRVIRDGAPDDSVVVKQAQSGGGIEVILLKPETAEAIAKEGEPYLVLHRRGRKMEEEIEINDKLTIHIKTGDAFQLVLRVRESAKTITLVDRPAILFVDEFVHARTVAGVWVGQAFQIPAPAQRQSAAPPSSSSTPPPSSSSTPPPSPSRSVAAAGVVKASDLSNEYLENEIAADQKYNGKTIRVTGVVDGFEKEPFTDAPVVLLKGAKLFHTVSCEFSKNDVQALAALKKGGTVTIQGTVTGMFMSVQVQLNNCRIL